MGDMAFRVLLAFYGAGFKSLKYKDFGSLNEAFKFRAGRLGLEGLEFAAGRLPTKWIVYQNHRNHSDYSAPAQKPHDLGPWTSRSCLNPKP